MGSPHMLASTWGAAVLGAVRLAQGSASGPGAAVAVGTALATVTGLTDALGAAAAADAARPSDWAASGRVHEHARNISRAATGGRVIIRKVHVAPCLAAIEVMGHDADSGPPSSAFRTSTIRCVWLDRARGCGGRDGEGGDDGDEEEVGVEEGRGSAAEDA